MLEYMKFWQTDSVGESCNHSWRSNGIKHEDFYGGYGVDSTSYWTYKCAKCGKEKQERRL